MERWRRLKLIWLLGLTGCAGPTVEGATRYEAAVVVRDALLSYCAAPEHKRMEFARTMMKTLGDAGLSLWATCPDEAKFQCPGFDHEFWLPETRQVSNPVVRLIFGTEVYPVWTKRAWADQAKASGNLPKGSRSQRGHPGLLDGLDLCNAD